MFKERPEIATRLACEDELADVSVTLNGLAVFLEAAAENGRCSREALELTANLVLYTAQTVEAALEWDA